MEYRVGDKFHDRVEPSIGTITFVDAEQNTIVVKWDDRPPHEAADVYTLTLDYDLGMINDTFVLLYVQDVI
jgi:hypothetical protein